MERYDKAPERNHTRRWPHQHRVRYSHNLEVDPKICAAVTILAEHLNTTKKEALRRIVIDWLWERPVHDALVRTEVPQLEVRHGG